MPKLKPKDPGGRHIRVYCSLLDSPAYRVLSFAAKALFTDLRSQVTGTNNGNLSAPLADMKHKGWVSTATLSKALYELRSLGFISITRVGGLRMGTRVCNLYRFTDLEVFDFPKLGIQAIKATHDYKVFDSVRVAEIALRDGVAALMAEGRKKQLKKNVPVRNLNRIGSGNELMEPFISSGNKQGDSSSVQETNRGNFPKNGSGISSAGRK